MGTPMRTITSAATFTVASQPSTSWVGSVSAMPISWADTGSHNGPLALGTAYELVRVSFGACSANFFSAQTTDPLTSDRAQFDGHAHENDNERRDFHGCIPAFDVVGGISLGDADFLGGHWQSQRPPRVGHGIRACKGFLRRVQCELLQRSNH